MHILMQMHTWPPSLMASDRADGCGWHESG
jgi:hypothetical protein